MANVIRTTAESLARSKVKCLELAYQGGWRKILSARNPSTFPPRTVVMLDQLGEVQFNRLDEVCLRPRQIVPAERKPITSANRMTYDNQLDANHGDILRSK